jgi:predicted HicB family RNase H-like nuclease
MKPVRTRKLTVRLSESEAAILREIAEAQGLSVSAYLRAHIRKISNFASGLIGTGLNWKK